MKFIYTTLFLFLGLVMVQAQTQGAYGLTLKSLLVDYESTISGEFEGLEGMNGGYEIGLTKRLSERIVLAFPLKLAMVDFDRFDRNLKVLHLDAQVQYHLYQSKRIANPYFMTGLGIAMVDFAESNVQIPFGFGVNVKLKANTFFNVQASYRRSFSEDLNNVQFGAGIHYLFGKVTEEVVEDQMQGDKPDSDGDGIIDELDNCPQRAGIAKFAGCPDTDGDGVEDSLDKCPEVAGLVEMNGCPDSDGDGIDDIADECPNLAGSKSNNGCPEKPVTGNMDRDGDGVLDKNDRCPNTPGPASNSGCPVTKTAKKNDRDGDGVLDGLDACPDKAGLKRFNGCPDADGDGVADPLDNCPLKAGPINNDGCPESDRDNDGVIDRLDSCPDTPGLKRYNGCPDTDGDGVADHLDRCPNKAGLKSNQGCPEVVMDRDGDGVADKIDRCPDRPGLKRFNGCPDTDGDGVADHLDRCPGEAGLRSLSGCPDSDGDGIANNEDRCPYKSGPKSNQGCPVTSVQPSTDRVVISQSDRELLDFAMRAIQFDHSRSTLKVESYAILDQIVEIMNRYPQYSVSIEGHTDNTGGASYNLRLSEQRALACHNYLVAKGIAPGRVKSKGFGETKPVADNNTYGGRSLNRRVEFNLYITR